MSFEDLSADFGDLDAPGSDADRRPRSSTPDSLSRQFSTRRDDTSPRAVLGAAGNIPERRGGSGGMRRAGDTYTQLAAQTPTVSRSRKSSLDDGYDQQDLADYGGSPTGSVVINTMSDAASPFANFRDQPGHTLPWRKSGAMRDIFNASAETSPEGQGRRGLENEGQGGLARHLAAGGAARMRMLQSSGAHLEENKSPRHFKPPLYEPRSRTASTSLAPPASDLAKPRTGRQRVVYPGGHRKGEKQVSEEEDRRPSSAGEKLYAAQQTASPQKPSTAASQFDTLTRAKLDALVNELDSIHQNREEFGKVMRGQSSASASRDPSPRRNFSEHSTSSSAYPSDIDFVDDEGNRPRRRMSSGNASPLRGSAVHGTSESPPRASDESPPGPRVPTGRSVMTSSTTKSGSSSKSQASSTAKASKKGFISAEEYRTQRNHMDAPPISEEDEDDHFDDFGPPLNLDQEHLAADSDRRQWSAEGSLPRSASPWDRSGRDQWSIGNHAYSPVLQLHDRVPVGESANTSRANNTTQENLNLILETLNNRLEAKLDRIAAMVSSPVKHLQGASPEPIAEASRRESEAALKDRSSEALAELRHDSDMSPPRPRLSAEASSLSASGGLGPRPAPASDALLKALGGSSDELREASEVDLGASRLESLYGLSSQCPKLRKLVAGDNQLTFLTGVPDSVTHLVLSRNRLSNLTSFRHLRDLKVLDVSHNQLQDLSGISGLMHLAELRADHNQICTLSGVLGLESLVRCSLRSNEISEITASEASRFPALEFLDVSFNRLSRLSGIDGFSQLQTLVADHNAVATFVPRAPMTSLVSLSLVHNELQDLDASRIPGVRALKLDGNRVSRIDGADFLASLEVLSINDQNGADVMSIDFERMAALRHLQISENVLTSLDCLGECSSLEVLDAGSCSLRGELPKALAKNVPNLRLLNLCHNKLTDISNVKYLHRLRRLILFDNHLAEFGPVIRALKACTRLEVLDLRDNPITQLYYAQMPVQLSSSIGVDSQVTADYTKEEEKWMRLDDQYKQALQDSDFVRRLCYRASLIDLLASSIRILDGIPVTEREKADARERVAKLRAKAASKRTQSQGRVQQTPRNGGASGQAAATPATLSALDNLWTPGLVTPGTQRELDGRGLGRNSAAAASDRSGGALPQPNFGRSARAPPPEVVITDEDARGPDFWSESKHRTTEARDGDLPELPRKRDSAPDAGGLDFDESMSVSNWKPVSYPLDSSIGSM